MNVLDKRQTDSPGRRLYPALRQPLPFDSIENFWRAMAQAATIVMCVLMFGVFLYVARALLLPVLCAVMVGLTFGPYIGRTTRRGVPAWLMAILTVLLLIAAANLAVIMLANPLSEFLRRTPELAAAFRDKLSVLDRPFAALYELQAALGLGQSGAGVEFNPARLVEGLLTIVTPAAVQFVLQVMLFVGTLFFFIVGRAGFRAHAVNWFSSRVARLRALKILNDIEDNLSGYLGVVTTINLCLGLVTTLVSALMGLPYPLLWGALAFALNYVPYVGPSIMYVLLFVIGILTYPTLLGALLPPAVFIVITLIEGQFLTPAIVGRQVLQLHPLTVFLSIAFWAWLWGPIGAFLATPILIVFRVVLDHLYPQQAAELPG